MGLRTENQANPLTTENPRFRPTRRTTFGRTTQACGTGQRTHHRTRFPHTGRADQPPRFGDDRVARRVLATRKPHPADGDTRPVLPRPCVLGNHRNRQSSGIWLQRELQLLPRKAARAYRRNQSRNSPCQQSLSHRARLDATPTTSTRTQGTLPRRSLLRTGEGGQATHRKPQREPTDESLVYRFKNI